MFEYFLNIAEEIILEYGLAGLFSISLLESFIFPVPTAGFITAATTAGLDIISVVLIATIGSVLGAITGYYIGKRGGRPLLIKLFNKKKLEKVDKFFEKYGVWAVLIAGFTPIPFKVFTISAGVTRINLPPFILACLISRFSQFFIAAEVGGFLHFLI